jgi:hypothetical protein
MATIPKLIGVSNPVLGEAGLAQGFLDPNDLNVNARSIAAAGNFTTSPILVAGWTVIMMVINTSAAGFSVDLQHLDPESLAVLATVTNGLFNNAPLGSSKVALGGNTGGVGDILCVIAFNFRNTGAGAATITATTWFQAR